MSHLFSPLKIKDIELKNRIAMSPMCMYSSEDGFANDWHMTHIGSRAAGGVGLIIMEATAVSPEGRITPHDLGLWKDEHINYLKRITSFTEKQHTVIGIQLAHAGRKASHKRPWEGGQTLSEPEGGWQTLAPSPIPFLETEQVPAELDIKGIKKIIHDFKAAAKRALEAGFKVIEIHAAHGYLIHEFLSPLSNKRRDEYGGTFENRVRLLLEIIDEVKQVWPENYPLFVRISATDWTEEGWKIEDSVALAKIIKTKGIDLIDCSSGGNSPHANIPVGPGYQVPLAAQVKKDSGILTGAVGMITTSEQADKIISSGQADIVLLARELLRNPYFAMEAAKELNADFKWPSQYERAKLN